RLEPRHDDPPLTKILLLLGEGVEVGAEHLVEEGHRVADRHQFVGLLEEERVILRSQQYSELPTAHPEAEDRAESLVATPKHWDRGAEEFEEMTEQRKPTRKLGHRALEAGGRRSRQSDSSRGHNR